ncbi:hypothetical protein MGR01S_29920 [Meiothermus granaticius NBRC 107808]|uniref:SpoVT-AbrB domain-containing protein n=2 Tax=Meiothermus TaxID=65551 RepID=A0A399F349_9DEIN|nr:hypothetical protein Mgrana_02951 [Meiothermus granaticius NBRC 107808]GEM88367.1 hypothetical protein MGR01S_29920 [Meiothermus granaticius NBRC 107808]
MQVELSPKELGVLLELLEEHRYFGWIYQAGEFGVEASGECDATANRLRSHKPRNPTFWYSRKMELAKLSRKGQVSIPRRLLRALGMEGEGYFLVELSPDGGILLRPAGVYPIEMYSQERIEAFLQEDALTPEENEKLRALQGA